MAIRKLGFVYRSVWLKIETARQVLEEVFRIEF
jgi:molybdenum-dependent DNA-binding transcriptional regulator ModE